MVGRDIWLTSYGGGQLARIDAATDRVRGVLALGSVEPQNLVETPDGLWVTESTGGPAQSGAVVLIHSSA